ncbi:hypothetical protein [Geodermatophilus sp. CPCC 205761]|uniref:hypothetical protein n=1 Tax=Geodermatophilus sp. CPCC 205761 TaxID=2936597 RepID=UPI003EEFF8E0
MVGLNAALVRTTESAVTLTHCLVYSRGVSFKLTALFRVDDDGHDDGDDPVTAAIMPIPGRRPDFILGLVLADEARLQAPVGEWPHGPYMVRHIPRAANNSGLTTSLWLTPLPPPGPLAFSVECASLGIEPVAVTIDAAALCDVAGTVPAVWD